MSMTSSMKFLFILYIAFASSYDGALAHEFEDVTYAISHNHFSPKQLKSLSIEKKLIDSEKSGFEHSSNSKCPDSETSHTPHHCHMGHCGHLPRLFSFLKENLEAAPFSNFIHIYKSKYLDGLFRPPLHT